LRSLPGNAWKFTGKCRQERIECVSKFRNAGAPIYCVTGNGAGFDMAYSDKLFQGEQRWLME